MLEDLKVNYYARFHTHSYHCCREMHNNSRLEVKFCQSQWSEKCRSKGTRSRYMPEECFNGNYYARFIFAAITAAEKCTSILDLM